MKEQIFVFHDIKEEYESLLEKLKNKTLSENYPSYNCMGNFYSYKIINTELNDSVVVFLNTIKVNILFDDSNKNVTFLARSNLDIKNFCKKNFIDINALYLNDNKIYKNDNFLKYLSYIKNKVLNLFFKEKEGLLEISQKNLFSLGEEYKVKEYSTFYKDYFEDENLDPDFMFAYDNNDIRQEIFNNIISLQSSNDLQTFKFTGPFNIGKSITLLEYSRTTDNSFYINLKCLKNKSIKDSYLMLQEEFARISSCDIFKEIQGIIKSNYYKYTEPIDLIIIIMKYLFEKRTNYNFLFIFDQFKEDYFSYNQKKYLEQEKFNLKLIYCSSINENKMRIECLKTWKEFNYNPRVLEPNNQKYYFYYVNIYSPPGFKDVSIMENIISIKRFKKHIINCTTKEEKILKIKEHIIEKMTKFSSQTKISFDYMISYLKRVLIKIYDNDKLDDILELCPLKYFEIIFLENHSFQIRTQFPLINQIINRKLLENEVFNYFKYNKYKRKLITNKTIKGDYFEEAAILGLKNILPNEYDYTLEVKEIISMEKIDATSLDFDYLEDDYEKDEEADEDKEDEEKDEDKEDEEKDEGEEEKKEEVHLYQKEENLNEENGMNRKENFIEINCTMNLDDLLEKFSVNNDNKRNNDLENLEGYRQKEIKRLKKINKDKKYIISKNYTGNETFLIRQQLKKGRVIDCAYLTGEQNDKTFIGFQMKCYFEETNNLQKRAYDKNIIKNNLKQLLINSMYLLNCKISHWYYYLIFYINKENAHYNVKDSIIQKYKGTIEILFYDPLKKIFYDCDKNILTELQKTDNADLDTKKKCLEQNELNSKINNYSIQNNIEIKNTFIKDFEFTGKNNEQNILKEISIIMQTEKKIIELDSKIPFVNNGRIRYPDPNSLFLYKKKRNGFLGMKTITDENQQFKVIYYDIEKKKQITIDDFNKYVDLSFGFIYILKARKRTYIDLSDKDPPSNAFPGKKKGKFY